MGMGMGQRAGERGLARVFYKKSSLKRHSPAPAFWRHTHVLRQGGMRWQDHFHGFSGNEGVPGQSGETVWQLYTIKSNIEKHFYL